MHRDRRCVGFRVSVLAVAVVVAACGGSGGGGTGSSSLFPLWVTTDVAISDVDGDGRPDVVTLAGWAGSNDQREGRVGVYRQTAPGVFAPPDTYMVGTYAWRVVVADVDGDGGADLTVTDAGDTRTSAPQPRTAVWLLRQNPAQRGRFLAPAKLAEGPFINVVAVGDVNGDGVPDVVVGDGLGLGTGAAVLVQDPQHPGTFLSPRLVALPAWPGGLAAVDIDGDGRNDVAAWVSPAQPPAAFTGALAWAYQAADGSLGPAQSAVSMTGLNLQRMVPTDANRDGVRDFVLFLRPSSVAYTAHLLTAVQYPRGVFAGVDTSLATLSGIDDAAVADLDGDGLPDAAIAGTFPEGSSGNVRNRVNVMSQTGGGAFALRGTYEVDITIGAIAAGDLDGDGRADLVVYGGKDECRVLYQSRTALGVFESPRPLR